GLWQGGLFGTTAGIFGPDSALGRYAGMHGLAVPQLNGVTNLGKMKTLMRGQYGGTGWMDLEAMKNFFGLSSMSQAAARDMMSPADLTASQGMLGKAGVNLGSLSATGMQNIARVAGAKNFGDLSKIGWDVFGKLNLSDSEKGEFNKGLASGDFSTFQNTIA